MEGCRAGAITVACMKVLVMGGTQFNGLALVHELVAQGHDVTVCNRGKTEADLPDSVHRLVADRTDTDQMREVLGGSEWDCVQDITAYHPEDSELMLELFRDRVGHYIFASSTVIYDSKDTPIAESDPEDRGANQIEYGLHKLLCEDILFAAHTGYGFPASVVPFSMVLGPHNAMTDREQRMFKRILEGRPVLMPGDGSTLLQLGDVNDQARALEQMMGKSATFGRRYNLTGKEAVTRSEYVATIGRVVECEPDVQTIPAEVMEALWIGEQSVSIGAASGALDTRSSEKSTADKARSLLRTRFMLSLNLIQQLAPNIHWWNQDTSFSIDRLRGDVGWEPRENTESMLERTYRWWQDSGRIDFEYDWTTEDQIGALAD